MPTHCAPRSATRPLNAGLQRPAYGGAPTGLQLPFGRKPLAAVTVFMATVAAALALSTAPAAAATATALHVQRAEIIDRQGFERPMVASSMLVPAGWRVQSTVAWAPAQEMGCTKPYQRRLSAQSQDGLGTLELLPSEGWGMTSTGSAGNNCPVRRIQDTQTYLRAWVQQHRPGARWLDYRARPDRSQPATQADLDGGGFMRRWAEGGQALIAYQHQGREVREALSTVVSFSQLRMAGLVGMPGVESLFGEALGVLAWRAPAGTLNFGHFDAVWDSIRSGPEWQARINQATNAMARDNFNTHVAIGNIHAQIGRDNLKATAERGENARRTREEIAALRDAGVAGTAATNERMHSRTERAVRGVEPYRDPAGGTVELPNHYERAWKLRDGTYVLTDSPDFRPGRDLGIEGELLKRLPN